MQRERMKKTTEYPRTMGAVANFIYITTYKKHVTYIQREQRHI